MTAQQKLRSLNGEPETILRIYLDRFSDGSYGGEISELCLGSSSDTGGSTVAEAVEGALNWAGLTGLSLPSETSVEDIREALLGASAATDSTIQVRLYTSF